MSVNSYLSSLASSLVISSSEKGNIDTSISTIKSRLSSYFGDDAMERILFGSYVRETILPRKADENSDIDFMVVFKNPNDNKPQTFLTRLKNFAEYYYNTSEIYQSSPTIVLELNHIKFELVPAKKQYDSMYYIPDKGGNWIYTDPNGFNTDLIECNKNNGYKIKPVVRLVKHWNIQKNDRNLSSFIIEKTIASKLKYDYINCSTYTDYLSKALDSICDFSNISKIDSARKHIANALYYEKNNKPETALLEIKKVFPEV